MLSAKSLAITDGILAAAEVPGVGPSSSGSIASPFHGLSIDRLASLLRDVGMENAGLSHLSKSAGLGLEVGGVLLALYASLAVAASDNGITAQLVGETAQDVATDRVPGDVDADRPAGRLEQPELLPMVSGRYGPGRRKQHDRIAHELHE